MYPNQKCLEIHKKLIEEKTFLEPKEFSIQVYIGDSLMMRKKLKMKDY